MLSLALGALAAPPAHAASDCKARPPGVHEPRARIAFTAVEMDGQERHGKQFDYGAVKDLIIDVDWKFLWRSVRQRMEIYGPTQHLYQMVTTTLPVDADGTRHRLPVRGSWITSASLFGPWCVKIFVDGHEEPVAAADFELRRRP
jgi:hypothetical protein